MASNDSRVVIDGGFDLNVSIRFSIELMTQIWNMHISGSGCIRPVSMTGNNPRFLREEVLGFSFF